MSDVQVTIRLPEEMVTAAARLNLSLDKLVQEALAAELVRQAAAQRMIAMMDQLNAIEPRLSEAEIAEGIRAALDAETTQE